MRVGFDMAVKDVQAEWALFLALTLAVAAALAPFATLQHAAAGLLKVATAEVRADPSSLEIRIEGNYDLTAAEVAAYAALPEVGFVAPSPRTIAARTALRHQDDARPMLVRVDLAPSGPNDPLRATRANLAPTEIALSAEAADSIGARVGDALWARNDRTRNGAIESITTEVRVAEIIPSSRLPGHRALAPVATMDRIEAFLDGYAFPAEGLAGRALTKRAPRFETMRIYATRLEDVARLDERLSQDGLLVRSARERVARVLRMQSALDAAAGLFAAFAAGAAGLALGLVVWTNMARKRFALSVLRLMGASRLDLIAFPATQAAIAGLGGALIAIAASPFAGAVGARALSPEGASALAAPSLAGAVTVLAISLGCAIVVGFIFGVQSARIDPADGIVRG